jgi:hypothetical protein
MAEGDFTNIEKGDQLSDAYRAITIANGWGWLKDPKTPGNGGFALCIHPMMFKISGHINHKNLPNINWIMTQMEYIAKNGWDSYLSKNGK